MSSLHAGCAGGEARRRGEGERRARGALGAALQGDVALCAGLARAYGGGRELSGRAGGALEAGVDGVGPRGARGTLGLV